MFNIKRGDTKEPLMVSLSDDNGPIDLTGCTVNFYMSDYQQNTLIISDLAEIRDAINGEVWYVFKDAYVAKEGSYKAEFEVQFTDFRTETFPSEGYILVNIHKDLGAI